MATNKPDETKQNKEQQNIPEELTDDKTIKTKVTTFKKIVEDKLMQLKDLATLEIMMPVMARMRERLKSINNMSQAQHLKIQGHWKTTPPKMHIRNPVGKKLSNDEAQITFGVYAMDEKGNKRGFENKVKEETASGRIIETVKSVDYKIAFEVTETIKMGKPITREILRLLSEE